MWCQALSHIEMGQMSSKGLALEHVVENAIDDASAIKVDRRVRRRVEGRVEVTVEVLDDSDESSDVDEGDERTSLNYGDLKKKWFDNQDYCYVASLEHLVQAAYKDKSTTLSQINAHVESYSGSQINTTTFNQINSMSKQILSRKIVNFTKLRQTINAVMPYRLFQIRPEMSLLKWVSEGKR